jgi:vitamin B12 transporter
MRGSWLFSAAALTVLAVAASDARGADADADSSDAELPQTVVVTATRIPTPELEVASSITVITAEDIEAKQERTLPDVLRDVPGLNLIQEGGPGGQTSVFMRGTNSNHTKVFVDGIDVSDPSSAVGTFDFGQFLTQDIERVEILRGPQSGLYGSDAIGGVINIITKSGSGPAQLTASLEGGSFETFNQAASLSGSDDQFHYSANLEHFHSGATPVTPLNTLAPGETRNDDYYDNLTASTKLGYDVTQNFDLSLVARYTDTHLHITDDDDVLFGFPDPEQSQNNTTEYYGRAAAHLVSWDGFLDQTLGFAYTRNSYTSLIPYSPESQDTGERDKIDWHGALKLSNDETLLLGAEHELDEITQPISAGITINSGYAELQSQITDSFFSAINARYDVNDRFGSKATYRFAPAYLIHATGTKLKASVGSGFKAPTLSELFENFPPYFYGNPNLKPESSTGYDAGIEQSLAADTIRAGATYFYNRIHDLIDSNVSGTSYANIGRATTQGVESFLSYRPLKVLTLRADYTYTEATDDVLQQELVRRPKNKASLNAAWQATHGLLLDATVLSVSSWIDGNRDFSIPRLRAPGYTIANVAASYDFTDRFTVFGRINNLFDRHYEDPYGFLQPSLGVFAGIKTRI